MCGIAVAIDWPDAEATVKRLVGGILHRGDVTDPLVTPRADTAMCTRRLRIVDAERGTQPQASFDGKLLVSFNGEIYNHDELRRDLKALGIPFRTTCDSEVLANALQAWGPSALKRLQGMYAFVAIDVATGAFLAARDPFGVKPLYLVQSGKGFVFCSEIRPLLDATESGDVMLLPPGYLLTRGLCTRFFALPAHGQDVASSGTLDRLMDHAVQARLPSDLPCAALFSGGIDSTLMLHYARRYRPDMPGYFIGGEDAPDFAYAREYADRTGLDLRMLSATAGPGALNELADAVKTVESFEPAVVRPSLCASRLCERIQADGFRVGLCGEGADELFAGYVALERGFTQSAALGRHLQEQSLSLMNRSNLQRVDRCSMRFSVELREPFLDLGIVSHAMSLGAEALVAGGVGKQPLRALYDLYPMDLPASIRDRRKIPFDEGAGLSADDASWRTLFEDAISDTDFAEGQRAFTGFEIAVKEELFYLRALAETMDVNRVPHLKGRLRLTAPQEMLAASA